jgi:predicted house-cleaning noncanonical NTP pyrophosphatase (MazG superfamily)
VTSLPAGKLVRDRIPELIVESGRQPEVIRLAAEERLGALRDKLREESDELAAASGDAVLGELADVLEVLRALAAQHHVTWSEVEDAAAAKAEERGAFTEGWYLVELR